MIIRCDGISGISPRSMTELPALLQPIATGMPTREPYSVHDRARCTTRVARGMTALLLYGERSAERSTVHIRSAR
jgi:hypothetical protein